MVLSADEDSVGGWFVGRGWVESREGGARLLWPLARSNTSLRVCLHLSILPSHATSIALRHLHSYVFRRRDVCGAPTERIPATRFSR